MGLSFKSIGNALSSAASYVGDTLSKDVKAVAAIIPKVAKGDIVGGFKAGMDVVQPPKSSNPVSSAALVPGGGSVNGGTMMSNLFSLVNRGSSNPLSNLVSGKDSNPLTSANTVANAKVVGDYTKASNVSVETPWYVDVFAIIAFFAFLFMFFKSKSK